MMDKIVDCVFWLLVVVLFAVCVNAELKFVKLDLPDTTKILMLMCIVVIALKKRNTEPFLSYESVDKKDVAGRHNCGYQNLDLNKDAFDPNKFCNYDNNAPENSELQKPLVSFPNSIAMGKLNEQDDPSKPSINGNENAKKSMFTLAYNKCSPDCCPSVYSSSCGCVCQNEEQNKFISSRGGNKTHPGI